MTDSRPTSRPTWKRRGLDEVRTEAPTSAAVLTPERRTLQDTARAFAMEEVLPVADALDPRREPAGAYAPAARGREPVGRPRALPGAQGTGPVPRRRHGHAIDKIGYFGLTTWELHLDGLRLPADALQDTGQAEGQGFKDSLRWLGTARVQMAARAVGARARALEDAVAYSRRREQFGHPIADQQALRHKLADLAAAVDAARTLWWHAAWLLDEGLPGGDVAASSAKLVASETAERVTSDALQVFGGNGYTTEPLGGALLARRPPHDDLRGHLGDPTKDHLRRPVGLAAGRGRRIRPGGGACRRRR
ncbi:acyl-CoA dehydrogenase family protein [Actinomycetospora cinnamomea]|uniref:Acyl-CoA dehydrogenase-like protein n=1 Tax=Actinomycetospora cinnamomea TaxID=663609 RepID=A0A2U1FQ65_9PSEU|nr:acyl-CoA dehydrogenase family protein [Actinomycetospora cinnamomea]PVZ14210.1 acyl-CoA dehydrogenase-like protein [Actinomycetospora cinnamomea]